MSAKDIFHNTVKVALEKDGMAGKLHMIPCFLNSLNKLELK